MATAYQVPTWKTGMREVAPNVHAYFQAEGSWFLSNAGLIVGNDYSIVIDSLGTIGFTQAMLDDIKKVTNKPLRYLANTHSHADHIWGNHLFSGAVTICHTRCREEIVRAGTPDPDAMSRAFPGFDFAGIRATPPDITFDSQLTLHLDEREVQLIYYQPGHTLGDIIAWLPQDSVVFAGDLLFLYSTPLCMQGSFAGWIEIMGAMLGLDAKVYVPGHGPQCGKEGVTECRDYLVLVHEMARKRFDAGMSAEDAARDIDLGHFQKWANWERIVANVARLYHEFRGEDPLSSPLDMTTIRAQMDELARSG